MKKLICMILAGSLLFVGTACKKEEPKNTTEEEVRAFLRGENEGLIDKIQGDAE